MRKLAIALVAAITVAAAVPAAAQGFYAGPGGIGLGVGPGYYDYGPGYYGLGRYHGWPDHRQFHHWHPYARGWYGP